MQGNIINTVILDEVELDVHWEHEPAEPQSWDCPGADAENVLVGVEHKGEDIIELLSASAQDQLLELAMEDQLAG